MTNNTINIVGGIYQEICMRPDWREIYGSAGRAASAISQLGGKVILHGYADSMASAALESRSALENFDLAILPTTKGITFHYAHGLATPIISYLKLPLDPIAVTADRVIRFGMIETEAIVVADFVVYDPQNVKDPVHFSDNGSRANHLALVLNQFEAATLSGLPRGTIEEMVEVLVDKSRAEVIIVKLGPQGALVWEKGIFHRIPAYWTESVWKIGSGDTFVANFSAHWMSGESALNAALKASQATAYYCQNRSFATRSQVDCFSPEPILITDAYRQGKKPSVYLAGPFFTLAQLWLVEEARNQLTAMGLQVFSPYHDVGHASAEDVASKDLAAIKKSDIVFAISDGLDSGTMFEIGFAKANGKPVIIYFENEPDKDLKMAEGAQCIIVKDYVSAIYRTLWEAIKQ
ncbi:PfkB family carbohydrate kinase [Undibacterium sp. TJN19]|uniref:PfkB family carbohydrate kinase n=1 Tax=Undibacterium sp. TJN19 TaxID=3413055 RepID=UPI003BF173E6